MRHRRNRRRKARSFLVPAPLVGVVVLALSLALIYLWMDQSCTAIGQQVRQLEQEQQRLRAELAREQNKWSIMKSPANLERALLRHGVSMSLPRPEQVVRVDGSSPVDGQEYTYREMYVRSERP